jgi:hypothetical protein
LEKFEKFCTVTQLKRLEAESLFVGFALPSTPDRPTLQLRDVAFLAFYLVLDALLLVAVFVFVTGLFFARLLYE